MSAVTGIGWTDATWNPVTGCTKISPGCAHCYAERFAKRLQAMGQPNYAHGFRLTLHPQALRLPLTWRQPRVIFVNSMSDLFHPDVPTGFIEQVFDVMRQADWHTYQVLTKREWRMAALAPRLPWPRHVWAGVSIERSDYTYRMEDLRLVPAAVRFLSLEPLLGPLPDLSLDGIGWVTVGGESGPGARPMDLDWVRDIRGQCLAAGVPLYLKQLGGRSDKRSGDDAILDGQLWTQMPAQVAP